MASWVSVKVRVVDPGFIGTRGLCLASFRSDALRVLSTR